MTGSERIRHLLSANAGVATYAQLTTVATRREVQGAVRRRELVRLHPATYALRPDADLPWTRTVAALRYAGPGSVLSHATALVVHGVLDESRLLPAHVTVPHARGRVGGPYVTFHRSRLRELGAPQGFRMVTRRGVPVVAVEGALVTTWPLLPVPEARACVFGALRDRRTTPARLRACALAVPGQPGTGDLVRLVDLVAAGCQSPLEVFGLLHVFRHPSLPGAAHQYPVRAAGRVVYLDVAYPELLLAIELDGRDWHRGAAAEHDRRRDAALAALGWQTIRFSGSRLFHDPDGVRGEVLAILRARSRVLGRDAG